MEQIYRFPPKISPSMLRYSLARFKVFSPIIWWIPSGLIVLGSICAWQYWSHPEWLDAKVSQAQPPSSQSKSQQPAESLVEDPLESLALDMRDADSAKPVPKDKFPSYPTAPQNPLAPINNPLNQENLDKNPFNNPISQLVQSPLGQTKIGLSQIFTPLIPSFKDTPVPSATDILKQISSSLPLGQVSVSSQPTISVPNKIGRAHV